MKESIVEISELLDDCINKSLSFNPYLPVSMNPGQEEFHNPYRWSDSGAGYEPMPIEHWKRTPDVTTQAYFDCLNGVDGALAKLRGFGKSLILEKAKYTKRTGTSGNYKYEYDYSESDEELEEVVNNHPQYEKIQEELAYRQKHRLERKNEESRMSINRE